MKAFFFNLGNFLRLVNSILDQALEVYKSVDAKKRIEKVITKKKLLTA